MKTIYTSLGFALGASAAALIPRDQSCFSLTASGGVSGVMGQLIDGQNRIQETAELATQVAQFTLSNGGIIDQNGRGCVVTPGVTQFQCDAGRGPTYGFSVSPGGLLEYNGSTSFSACPTGEYGGYNVYVYPVAGQKLCVNTTLTTNPISCNSTTSSSGASSSGASSSAVSPVVPVGSAPAGSSSVYFGTSPAGSAPASSVPVSVTSAAGSVPVGSAPIGSVSTASVPESSAPAGSAPASSEYSATVPESSAPGVSTAVVSTSVVSASTATVPESSAPAGSVPASSAPAGSVPASSAPGVSTSVVSASTATVSESSAPAGSVPASSAPAGSVPASSAPGVSTAVVSTSVVSASTATVPESSAPAGSVPASSASAGSVPVSSSVATSATAPYGTAPYGTSAYGVGPSGSAPYGTAPAGSSTSPTGTVSASSASASSSASGSVCQTSLSGAYQTPEAIIPVNKQMPSTSYGTQYDGWISGTNSTVFNFNVPASYSGKQCTLIFLFPEKSQLETSDFTLSGSGGLTFDKLSSAVGLDVTYSSLPSVASQLYQIQNLTPGNSYVVSTGACAAGTTESFEVSATGSLDLWYFEDWNPSPIGLFMTSC